MPQWFGSLKMLDAAERLKSLAEDKLKLFLDREKMSCIRSLCKSTREQWTLTFRVL